MTLIEEAERAEKIRNAFVVFAGACPDDVQDINKAISELSSLSCVLREIENLIRLDTGTGFDIIHDDLQYVHEDVTFTLGDVWQALGRLGRGHTYQDYQQTWKEITDQAREASSGKTLHKTLEGYRRFLESLSKTLDSSVITPTVERLRGDIQGIRTRQLQRTQLVPAQPAPLVKRTSSKRESQLPQLKKSYERARPMSPTDSSMSSTSDHTRFRDKPWVPSPPLSPTATMSSISQVSSTPSLETNSTHWARTVFTNVSSTPLPWSAEQTRYHEQHGTKEHSHPNSAYESVLNLGYPEGIRISLYCKPTDYRAKIVASYRDHQGKPDYACLPLEDLHIRREGSVLRICRRKSSGKPVPWVTMKFTTVERMVLFAGTFIAMRSQDSVSSAAVHDDELRDELSEFAGSIMDSGYNHALRIYHDKITGSTRLQASVLKGELDRTPVWTAFITHAITSPEWCRQYDKRTIALAELRPHIFSARYRPQLAPSGAFMLRFEMRDDAEAFLEVIDSLRERRGGF